MDTSNFYKWQALVENAEFKSSAGYFEETANQMPL